jgi:uncharacterized membrane protein YphA (DoxX/SURF4 family)
MTAKKAATSKFGWLDAISPRFWRAPSVIVLIAANLLPLYGVLFWGWDLYTLMVLYWMETGIIGFFGILEMALAARLLALMLVPFFIVHFGGFMAGHIFFLTVMFGDRVPHELTGLPDVIWALLVKHGLWLAFAGLFVSHGLSFVLNVLPAAAKEWRATAKQKGVAFATIAPAREPMTAMTAPYARIVVMHVTILVGALLVHVFRTKLAALLLLIVLKIAVDIAAHVRRNFRPVVVTTS